VKGETHMTVSVTKEDENPPSPPFRKGGNSSSASLPKRGTSPFRKGDGGGFDEDSF